MLAPELSVRAPLNSYHADYRWRIWTVSLGAALKFNIAHEKPLEVVHVEPPPPPPPARPKSEITAKVKISGVGKDSTGQEQELHEPQLRVEEFVRLESYPTLNYIFFDSGSSSIPSRYHLFSSGADASNFDPKSLSGRTSVDVYHDLLNIVGKRLRDKPSTKITITGSNDGHEASIAHDAGSIAHDASDISNARAESIKQYFVSAWQIDPARLTTEATTLPHNASATDTKDGSEENRRVEITSNDPSLLDPLTAETIDRTMNPPKIRLRTTLSSNLPLVKNTLALRQGSRSLIFFNSANASQDWTPTPDDLPRTDTPMVAILSVRDSLGAEAEATDTATVEQVTIKKKREERVKDKIIEHYNLITFDFDKADLDSRSKRVIADIAQSVTPNDKIVIRGYTDMTGERSHNLELSQERAKAVAAALHQSLGAKAATATVETEGEGESNLVDNRLPEGRFLSRTVFVELQKPVQ